MGAIATFLPRGEGPDLAIVRAMSAAVPHRGMRIDAVDHGRCVLACVNGDAQPDAAVGVSGDLAIAFVGTLDNAADLVKLLGEPGELDERDFLALLAAAYRAFGFDFPSRLRGVFAAVVTDGTTVYCFRDQLGYKPLFYRRDARGFYAATEAKQVVVGAGIQREPDLMVMDQLFYQSLTDDSPAALQGVERLPKMTGLIVDGDGARRRRYWHPERLLESARLSSNEVADRFDALMDTAVTRCLTGRDAISLSGGIDSPAVAAYAAPRHLELSGRPLQAITVVYPKYRSVDETQYVKLLSKYFDIPLHTYEQTANPLADLARWTALADTPYAGASLSQYEEDYRRARAMGVGTLLTGEHAEFLISYRWKTLDHYLSHGRFGAAKRELAAKRSRGWSWFSLAKFVARAAAPDQVLVAADRLRGRRSPFVPTWVDARKATAERPVPVRDRWRNSQLNAFIGPGLSVEADEVCQAVCGILARRPWTDVDLWEFFLSLPAEQKFPDLRPKSLVRTLLRGRVPDEILDRQDKTVFGEAALATIDYPTLRSLLSAPHHRVQGVDYALLRTLLESERLTTLDLMWARNLAGIHAFLSHW